MCRFPQVTRMVTSIVTYVLIPWLVLRIVIWRETPRPGSGKNGHRMVGSWYCWWFRNPKQPPFGCKKLVNNGMNYQPQLISRISSINSRKGWLWAELCLILLGVFYGNDNDRCLKLIGLPRVPKVSTQQLREKRLVRRVLFECFNKVGPAGVPPWCFPLVTSCRNEVFQGSGLSENKMSMSLYSILSCELTISHPKASLKMIFLFPFGRICYIVVVEGVCPLINLHFFLGGWMSGKKQIQHITIFQPHRSF